jgi:hypothetical protein
MKEGMIMKKIYLEPQIRVCQMRSAGFICTSNQKGVYGKVNLSTEEADALGFGKYVDVEDEDEFDPD